jgi:hypothetical protein
MKIQLGEMLNNEIFVGNVKSSSGIPKYLSTLKTVRLGTIALDIDGNKIDDMRPMFIEKSEIDVHENLAMADCLGPDWRLKVGR